MAVRSPLQELTSKDNFIFGVLNIFHDKSKAILKNAFTFNTLTNIFKSFGESLQFFVTFNAKSHKPVICIRQTCKDDGACHEALCDFVYPYIHYLTRRDFWTCLYFTTCFSVWIVNSPHLTLTTAERMRFLKTFYLFIHLK